MSPSLPESPTVRGEPLPVGIIWLLVLAAAGLRVGWAAYRYGGAAGTEQLAFADERDYWLMARSWSAGQTMRDADGRCATRLPGYPAFLSLWGGGQGAIVMARLAQGVVGASLVVFVGLLAHGLGGRALAVLASLLVTLDPFSVFFSGLLLSETLFTAALWLFVLLAWPVPGGSLAAFLLRCGGASIAAVLACYLHPSAVIVVPLMLVGVLLRWRPRRRGLAAAGIVLCVAIVALVPWAYRNKRAIGRWQWLTTRGGISLYDGVGTLADGSSNLGYARDLPAVRNLDEVEWNDYFWRESIRLMGENPVRVLRLAWPKLLRTWSPVPNAADYQSAGYRLIGAGWMLPVMLLCLFGLWSWRRRWPDAVLLLLPAIGITALHMILPGSVRYRVPAMPGVELLAAVGACQLKCRLLGRFAGMRESRPTPPQD